MGTLTTTTNTPTKSLFLDPEHFEAVQRACTALASSDLVPDLYRVSAKQTKEKAIANCMIALDMANRLGADPLMVMQNMYIVYGKPGWSSAFLIATINSSGRFAPLKYQHGQEGEIELGGKMYPNLTCYAYTSERGSNDVLKGAKISIAMAKAEGWTNKTGSKWLTMPSQMLMYRASAFWCRAYAPEISMGLHTIEEWQDVGDRARTYDAPFEEVTPATTPATATPAEEKDTITEPATATPAEEQPNAKNIVKQSMQKSLNSRLF